MIALRCLLAAALGAGLYAWAYHPWLSYSMRERSMRGADFLIVAAVAAVAAMALAWGTGRKRLLVAVGLVAGMWVTNAVVIAADLRLDPTSHNLLPFEFVILGIVASP